MPFAVSWKGRLPAGKVYDNPVIQLDILPTALAAADEEAVEAFLTGGLPFLDIPALLADTLDRHISATDPDLDQIMAADAWARTHAREWIKART